MNNKFVIAALAATVLLASCVKDEQDALVSLADTSKQQEEIKVDDSMEKMDDNMMMSGSHDGDMMEGEGSEDKMKMMDKMNHFTMSYVIGKDILVDSEGMTLYVFKKDGIDLSNCVGECLVKWPIFYDKDLESQGFTGVKRSDGAMQTSYKGSPLYTFFKDTQPGDINGHGVKDVWYVVDSEVSFLSMKVNEEALEEVLMDKTEHEAKMESGEWTDEEMKMMEDMKMKEDSADTMKKSETVMEDAGIYTAYDEALIGKTENTVIFFHATWCPSCRAADAVISKEEIPAGLTILKTDYDSNTDLRKKYGVVSQHTFVQVDANGELIKKWLGGNSVAEIEEKLQ